MGVLYLVASMVLAGTVVELVSFSLGDGDAGRYDYHFANGVGAVFGARR